MIVVTGAGGKTGQVVVAALARRGAAVRALVRRAEQGPTLLAQGAQEFAVGDMRSEADLRRALAGAKAVYHIGPNVHPDEQAIGLNAIAAARAEGVGRFVYHSVLHPQTENMPHHWRKLRVEEAILASGLRFTILQPAPYMQNILAGWNGIVEQGQYRVPYPVTAQLSLVDLLDVAEAAALVLTQPGHDMATYEIAGSGPMSQIEVAANLADGLGRPVEAVSEPVTAWEQRVRAGGLDGDRIGTLQQMFEYYTWHGLAGNPNVLTWLLGRPPATLPDFVARMVAVFEGQMTITAIAAAPGARAWLANTKTARVLNVFERACNLVNPAGVVLSLVSSGRGMTPFALLLPGGSPPFSTLVSDRSLVRVESDVLRVGALDVVYGQAPVWDPSPDWAAVGRVFDEPSSLVELATLAAELPPRGSLLDLYRAEGMDSPLAARARSGGQLLLDGLVRRDAALAIEGVALLAGAGGGLTPAGDDFITGALLAGWAGLYGPGFESLAAAVAQAAAKRTTTLSGAYLRAAALGECSSPWHTLFKALVAQELPAIRRALEALLTVGHTSGGDGLAGFLALHFLAARPVQPGVE